MKEGTYRNKVSVEAAAVKALVSRKLNLVVNRLAPLIIKKYNSTVGVKKDLLDLQLLAHGINNRLEAARDRALGDDQCGQVCGLYGDTCGLAGHNIGKRAGHNICKCGHQPTEQDVYV